MNRHEDVAATTECRLTPAWQPGTVSAEKLRGFTCAECGGDLADHEVEASKLVPLDKAYAMNADKVTERVSFGV